MVVDFFLCHMGHSDITARAHGPEQNVLSAMGLTIARSRKTLVVHDFYVLGFCRG